MAGEFDPEKARADFLIAMYNQLMNDINRHIVVVWQSVGVLFGAFAVFALVEKQVISLDIATSLIILLCGWVVAHVQDASYWYNRNLVIIANIERQFLRQSDLKEIHYYFGEHRRSGAMITHLRIQLWLAAGVAALVLLIHFVTVVLPVYGLTKEGTGLTALPWLVALIGSLTWRYWYDRARTRYENFLRNSPGRPIDASDARARSSGLTVFFSALSILPGRPFHLDQPRLIPACPDSRSSVRAALLRFHPRAAEPTHDPSDNEGALGTPPSGLCITRRLPIVNSTDTPQQCGSLHNGGVEIGSISQEVQMCSWENVYRGLANEAKERAAHATNPSIKDNFEEVAKEWSALAVWADLKQKSSTPARRQN